MLHLFAGGLAAGMQIIVMGLWLFQNESVKANYMEAALATALLWLIVDGLMRRIQK